MYGPRQNYALRNSDNYSPVEVRADLVGTASLESVALSAAGLEETSTLASVTCGVRV